MTIVMDIPQEFEEHYMRDRFADSLERVRVDIESALKTSQIGLVSGNYELELIKMLRNAFKEAGNETV